MSKKAFQSCCIEKLQPGDVVRHMSGGEVSVVTANYGERATAVRTVDITNEDEWLVLTDVGEVATEVVFVEDPGYTQNCCKCCYTPGDGKCSKAACMPHLRPDRMNGHFELRIRQEDVCTSQ